MPEIALQANDLRELVQEILAKGGVIRLLARGRSMEPFIADGDTIVVSPVDPSDLSVGMIVLYRSGPFASLAHRIVRMEPVTDGTGPVLVVRGDAPACRDERVSLGQVLGFVLALERNGQLIRLDRGRWWLAGRIWAHSRVWGLAFVSPRLFARALVGAALSWCQRFAAYRRCASMLVRPWIEYGESSCPEAPLSKEFREHATGHEEDVHRSSPLGQVPDSSSQSSFALVAVLWGYIVGALVLRRRLFDSVPDMDWWIVDVMVRVPVRGTGIATRLVDLAIERAISEGAREINVLVEPGHRPVQGFWSRMGFRPRWLPGLDAAVDDGAWNKNRQWVVMSKPLHGPAPDRDRRPILA